MKCTHNNLLTLCQIINRTDFPSFADRIAEQRPDMNIKVITFTVSKKFYYMACKNVALYLVNTCVLFQNTCVYYIKTFIVYKLYSWSMCLAISCRYSGLASCTFIICLI